MGEARKRKNSDGSYKSFKGDDFKYTQLRMVTKYLKYLREKKVRKEK